jgi:ankyrin repeat protein
MAITGVRMTQPSGMRTKNYVYGVEKLDGNDAWALFEAAAVGDAPAAGALLAKDRGLANAQYWYQFPIHLAVYGGHAKVVKVLLAAGADPGQSIYTYNSWNKLLACAEERGERAIAELLRAAMREKFNYSPEFEDLQRAIVERDRRKIERVLRRRPKLIHAADALGNTTLHWAVVTRQLDLLKRFVAAGTSIDARRADGLTAAMLAASGASDYWYRNTRGRAHPSLRNSWVLAGALLALGADYNISIAAAAGDLERIEALIARDSGLASRLDSARVSPLSYAAHEGHLHIVQRLLELGADPNLPEDAAPQGRALFEACTKNHYEIAELLLAHGADPNAGTDSNGCCLTICEVCHGERAKPLQKLLRKHGAYTPLYAMNSDELKKAIRDRRSPIDRDELLGIVCERKDTELLLLFLASPGAKDLVRQWGGAYVRSLAMMEMLLLNGLDPRRPDWLGKTSLHHAAEHGDYTAVTIFLKAGADVNACDVEFQGTPLAAAIRSGTPGEDAKQAKRRRRTIEILLRAGTDIRMPLDKPWATPLAWARKGQQTEIEAMLELDRDE